jgi:hypothetical protein
VADEPSPVLVRITELTVSPTQCEIYTVPCQLSEPLTSTVCCVPLTISSVIKHTVWCSSSPFNVDQRTSKFPEGLPNLWILSQLSPKRLYNTLNCQELPLQLLVSSPLPIHSLSLTEIKHSASLHIHFPLRIQATSALPIRSLLSSTPPSWPSVPQGFITEGGSSLTQITAHSLGAALPFSP